MLVVYLQVKHVKKLRKDSNCGVDMLAYACKCIFHRVWRYVHVYSESCKNVYICVSKPDDLDSFRSGLSIYFHKCLCRCAKKPEEMGSIWNK